MLLVAGLPLGPGLLRARRAPPDAAAAPLLATREREREREREALERVLSVGAGFLRGWLLGRTRLDAVLMAAESSSALRRREARMASLRRMFSSRRRS